MSSSRDVSAKIVPNWLYHTVCTVPFYIFNPVLCLMTEGFSYLSFLKVFQKFKGKKENLFRLTILFSFPNQSYIFYRFPKFNILVYFCPFPRNLAISEKKRIFWLILHHRTTFFNYKKKFKLFRATRVFISDILIMNLEKNTLIDNSFIEP